MDPQSIKTNPIKWLNALIAMAQWDKALPFYFAKLFNDRDEYKKALELIRKVPREGPIPEPPGPILNKEEWRMVYEKTTTTASLLNLFENDADPFKDAMSSQIWVLAEVSDLTSEPQTMFYSQNGTFHLVLNTIRQNSELNTKALIADCFNRFYALFDTDLDITELLYELSCSHDWYPVLASLKDARDYTIDDREITRARLKAWDERLSTEQRKRVLDLFHVPRALVKLAWERRDLFDKALNKIEKDQRSELRQQVPNVAHSLFLEEAKTEVEKIESDLMLLAEIARHCISTRKFVKLDGLVYSWPRIASLAMANYASLQYVEGLFLKRKPKPSDEELQSKDARELYELCASNKAVIRFLKLRPYFQEIDENELRRYRKLSRGVSDPSRVASGVTSSSNVHASVPQTVSAVSTTTQVCELVIKSIPGPPPLVPEQEQAFEVLLRLSNEELATATVTFSIRKLLDRMLGAIGVTSEDSLHSVLKNLFSSGNAEDVLLRGGKELYSTIIVGSGLEEKFKAPFESGKPVRLIVVIPSIREELHCLPWEWFPEPRFDELLLSNSQFSLVRSKPVRPEISTQPLTPPIRIMGLFPNAPIGTRDISSSSMSALGKLGTEGAHYKPLAKENANLARIKEELEKFHPHIVHFEGYVSFSPEDNAGLRIFFSKSTNAEPVGLPEFEALLKASHVQLLVIGRNESNRVYGNAAPVLASRLVRMAVPTVLAPIRAVDEVTANGFTTEFYRAFIRGGTLEEALFVARQKVQSTGGDWTPFALFSDPWVLDGFRSLPSTL